ncbi:hypothetical protein FISHEDRAFT_17078, partial [Fistulina hepatica ATCC 64428]
SHGPMLLGTSLNLLLYGISITQTYLYWNRFRNKDKLHVKVFVGFLFIADTLQTLFTVIYMYQALVVNFGDFDYLMKVTWVFSTDPALGGIINGCVQSFFAWRVLVLTGAKSIVLLIAFLTVVGVLAAIGTAIACGIVGKFLQFWKFRSVVIVWLASCTLSDIIIATVLVMYLRKKRTGFPATDSQLDKIIRLTIQTGMFTCRKIFFLSTTDLVFYLSISVQWHLLLNFPLSKLYTNSLMSSLNNRMVWKNAEDCIDGS